MKMLSKGMLLKAHQAVDQQPIVWLDKDDPSARIQRLIPIEIAVMRPLDIVKLRPADPFAA